jgi:Asp-tRNA(Asn)/Glu-tRNA(Gln) amidotransferase A subunit family amidase
MAVQGPLVRSVRDARLALAAMAQGDPVDTHWVDAPLAGPPPRSIHVALVAQNPGGFTHPAQVAAVQQAGRHLAAAGYVVDEVMLPDPVSKIGHTAAVYLFDDRGRVRQIVGQMALASADIPAIAADLEPLAHRASG